MNAPARLLLLFAAVLLLFARAGAQQPDTVFYLPVKSGNLWGYADTTGKVIIQPEYDAAGNFVNNIAIVQRNGKAFAIDAKDRVITPAGFDLLRVLSDSLLAFYSDTPDSMYAGGWGAMSLSGKELLGPEYDEIIQLDYRVIGFRKDTAWGYMHRRGNLIVDAAYDTGRVVNLRYLRLSRGIYSGLVSIYGQWILPVDCTSMEWMTDSVLMARRDSGWGITDVTGNIIVPFRWDSLRYFSNQFVEVRQGDSAALYSPAKKALITDFGYTRFIPLDLYWAKGYTSKKRCALVDTAGTIIIPADYSDIVPAGNGSWLVLKDKKWGIVSPQGKILADPAFTNIQPFRGSVTIFYSPEGQGLINAYGTVLLPAGNYSITARRNVFKIAKADGSAEFITVNENGAIVSRENYEQVRTLSLSGGNAQGKKNKNGYFAKADSLQWFSLPDRELYGLRNAFTGDTVIPPMFSKIRHLYFCGCTEVTVDDTLTGPAVNGELSRSDHRVGIVVDSTGNYLFRPNYFSLNYWDLWGNPFNGYIRGCRDDGNYGLFSTDGKERRIAFTFVGRMSEGKAVAVIGGEWIDANTSDPEVMGWKEFRSTYATVSSSVKGSRSDFSMMSIRGGKWGYIDSTGRFVIPAVYVQARDSYSKTCMVRSEKGWGMLDSSGKELIPLKYYNLTYLYNPQRMLVRSEVWNPHYGYVSHEGNIVIPAGFTQARSLGNGFVGCFSAGGWSVYNSKGVKITSEPLLDLGVFSEGILAVRKGRAWGFIDTTGAWLINPVYERVRKFSDGKCAVRIRQKWGFADRSGSLVVAAEFSDVTDFNGGAAGVKTKDGWRLIDSQGNFIGKTSFTSLRPVTGGTLFCGKRRQKLGLFSANGTALTQEIYDDIGEVSEGRILLRQNGLYGFCDTLGKMIVNPVYERAYPFSEGLAAVRSGGRWGYIGKSGKMLIAPVYKSAGSFFCERAYIISEKNIAGYIDTAGKEVFMLRKGYTGSAFSENRALISCPRYGCYYVNRHGQRINRMVYSSGHSFQDGTAVVSYGGYYGIISFTGEYIVSPRFNRLDRFEGPTARYQRQLKLGLYTIGGHELLPAEYDWLEQVRPGIFYVMQNNEMGYIRGNGRWIWTMRE